MTNKELFYENLFYNFLDEIKFMFFPDKWSSIALDYSKNELLAIIYIYRNKVVTTSEIASYINAPLNTVTGVVNRLEKKKVVERIRDTKDKRIVNISLTDYGLDIFNKEKDNIIYYIKKIYSSLNEEEISALMAIISKVIPILKEDRANEEEGKRVKKIKRIIIE